jgi:manganese transport protein
MSTIRNAPTDFRGVVGQLGPGMIISATIVGSGELIVTTRLGAETGFRLLWFIILGCLIKVFLQIELGRFAITHGKTSLQAMNLMPGPRWVVSWLVWVWLLMFVATFFQVAGMIGGASKVLTVAGVGAAWPVWVWPLLISAVTAVLLAVGRYRLIEWFSTIMVAMFTLFTIAAVLALNWTEYGVTAGNLAEGLSFRMPDSFTTAFAAFGIIGVGASELIYYPYWCLEKGYAASIGPNDGSTEWRVRAQGWLRVLRIDAWVSMVVYTLATIAFYLLGAAVLHAKGLKVTNDDLVPTLSHMYRESFGEAGYWAFLLGAFMVLYKTVFLATASNGRLSADLFGLFGWVRLSNEEQRMRLVKWVCVGLAVLYFVIFAAVEAPVTLVLIGALGQALMLPFLAAAALYFLYRKIDPALRPGGLWQTMFWLSAVMMTVMGGYQLVTKLLESFD